MYIVKSKITDHIELTVLTKKSKAFWGYGSEQIKKWDRQLTISKSYLSQNEVYKLVDNNRIIGYYSYIKINKEKVKLDNIFILPEFIGKKWGIYLMEDFFLRIKKTTALLVTLDSEPNAVNFYKKLGFKIVGQLESSIKNRFMPIMEIEL